MMLYAKQNNFNDWRSISPNFIPRMIGQDGQRIDDALGLSTFAGAGADNDFAGVMRELIAYSAIDEGTRIFGDKGFARYSMMRTEEA